MEVTPRMRKYAGIITAAVCGIILMILSILWQDLETATGIKNWILILSNAALVPGVLLTGLGLIVRIADENIFDGIKYSISSIISHMKGESKHYASYYDYLQREKKKNSTLPLLLPGLFFLAAAIVLTLLYYHVS